MLPTRLLRVFSTLTCAVTMGCSGPAEVPTTTKEGTAPVPEIDPGTAVLGGTVLDAAGDPVAGATLVAAETEDTATTGADGTFLMGVTADTTLSIRVTADGLAPTLADPVAVPKGTTSTGFEVRLLTAEKLDKISKDAGVDFTGDGGTNTRGTIAVMVVSLGGTCTQEGAAVAFVPSEADIVRYAPTSPDDALVDPDDALTSVQPDAPIAAYVVGVIPPAVYDQVALENSSCSLVPSPVTFEGRTYEGGFSVATGALSQVTVFIQ
jgi:hypothetical protein